MKELVNFFIIGTQKGGTTALDGYLREHPRLQLARVKEVHHFDDEQKVDWSAPSHARLHAQFDWGEDGVIRGEATPIYIYWPQSLPRLQRYNPAARLIVGLRHPSFRALSHWRMERSRNADDMPFDQAISNVGRARVGREPNGAHRVFSYVERSLYSAQIERLLDLFPREQIHFFRTDRLWGDPDTTLTAIERFLGVETVLGQQVQRRYVVAVNSTALGALPLSLKAELDSMFRDDIIRTAGLTQLDLADWLNASYQEPMRDGTD